MKKRIMSIVLSLLLLAPLASCADNSYDGTKKCRRYDVERTGTILENLSAESYGELKNAYAETALNFKYIICRDKESIKMLDIILNSGILNLTDVLGITSLSDSIMTCINSGSTDLASAYSRSLKISTKLLEKNLKGLLGTDD